jgi:tonB-dependent receptor
MYNYGKKSFYVRHLVNQMTDATNSFTKYLPNGDIVDESRGFGSNWTLRGQIDYNRAFDDAKHRVSAIAGAEIRSVKSNTNKYATRVGYNPVSGTFAEVDAYALNNGEYASKMVDSYASFGIQPGTLSVSENRFVSYYANASYELLDKYLVSGSIRMDLTNFFGTDPKYRYRPLWSIGGTWKLSNEEFFNVPLISRLNLRASYGINGNISLSQGPFLIISSLGYNNEAGGEMSQIASPPNDQLRWEKTKTTNFGMDFSMFDDRLSMTLDYYIRKSVDLLASDNMDPTTGYASLSKNVGSIRNSGVEVSLGGRILDQDLKWNTNLVFAYNKNKVLKYNVNRVYTSNWTSTQGITVEDRGMGALFSYDFAGLNENGKTMVYNVEGEKIPIANAKEEDLVYNGTYECPYSLAFSNQFNYKNWEFSFMLSGKFGGKFRRDGFYGANIESRFFKDRWKEPGDEKNTMYPVYDTYGTDKFYTPYLDVYVVNSSYIKLRDLVLAYNLPSSWLGNGFFKGIKASVQMRNIFTIKSKEIVVDPETAGTIQRPELYVGLSINF